MNTSWNLKHPLLVGMSATPTCHTNMAENCDLVKESSNLYRISTGNKSNSYCNRLFRCSNDDDDNDDDQRISS